MPEMMGGGYQYPKAVLDVIGKRYVVETGQTENGWFTRYSDGWIEQGGSLATYGSALPTETVVTFPIEFMDLTYTLSLAGYGGPWGGSWDKGIKSETRKTTGFTYTGPGSGPSTGNNADWRAEGYAKN